MVWIDGHGREPKVHALKLDAADRVTEACRIPLGGAALLAPAGAQILRGAEALTLIGGAVALAGAEISTDVEIAVRDGAVTFALQAPAAALTAELRYFFAKPTGANGIGALRYPALKAQSDAPVAVTGRFDPTHPGAPDSGLTLVGHPGTGAVDTAFRTTLGRMITLTPIAGLSQICHAYDPAEDAFYAAPKGDWALAPTDPPAGGALNMLMGLSGLELGRIDAAGVLRFVPGAPACAPGFGASGSVSGGGLSASCPGIARAVTTSWIYPLDGVGARAPSDQPRGYYAQPDDARFEGLAPEGARPDLLAQPACRFPRPADAAGGGVLGAPAAAFPMVPYAGLVPGDEAFGTYRAFEADILAPLRAAAIAAINRNAGAAPAASPARDRHALARCAGPQGMQTLQLTAVDEALGRALGRDQLFLVISDPEALMRHASVQYAVTDAVIAALAGPPAAVAAGMKALARRGVFDSLALFAPEAKAALGAVYDVLDPASGLTWGALLLREAAQARMIVDGWGFDLSPARWADAQGGASTIMVVKYGDGAMNDLVAAPNVWAMADDFNADPEATRARLAGIIAAARGDADCEHLIDTVVDAPSWRGVLFLNAPAPASMAPRQIEALAGANAPQIRAHHLGFTQSSITPQGAAGESAAFGFIRHADAQAPGPRHDPYDVRLRSLKVLFANSQVAGFSARAELSISALFGEGATRVGGDQDRGVILEGAWQTCGATETCSFASTEPCLFAIDSHVLHEVAITGVRLAVDEPQAGGDRRACLVLRGGLRFHALEGLDLFSFGPGGGAQGELLFSDLQIAMTVPRADPADRRFAFEAGRMAFDMPASVARPDSLARRLALSVAGMAQSAPGPTPAPGAGGGPGLHELGFIEVSSALGTGTLGRDWFGLEMALPQGATLLAAWAPDARKANVALGLRLSSSGGMSRPGALPLMMDIGAVEAMVTRAQPSRLARIGSVLRGCLGGRVAPTPPDAARARDR